MNLNKSNGLSGDLNYLVTNYLLNEICLQPEETNKLLSRIKENLNFGSIYDFDLNQHQCTYEQRREIYERVVKQKLDDIYGSSKNFISPIRNNYEKNEIGTREEKIFSNDDMMDILSEVQGKDEKKKEIFRKPFNSFGYLTNAKSFPKSEISIKENLNEAKLKSYKHMKSILGHISTVDDNIINPVAIYCICYSNDNELIFTGDNNGLIKIWSSRTGALVDIFKSHEKAINDILLVKEYLISCSDDRSIKIWNVKQLNLIKTLNFEESINRVISYEFFNDLTEKVHDVIIASSTTGKIFIFDLEKVVDRVNNINRSPNEYENEMIISKIYFDKKIYENFFLKKVKNNLQQSCMVTHKIPGILICGYNEGLICVWDLKRILEVVIKNDKFLYDFEKYILFLEYVHNSLVHISEFNKAGDYFITAGIDGHVLVWKVQEDILKLQRKAQKPEEAYPIFSIFKISENEERIRCSVNVAIWSTHNNYVVSIISSKPRKKTHPNNPTIPQNISNQNMSQNQTHINNHSNESNQNNNHNQLNDSQNNDGVNRTSSILVYSRISNSVIRRYDHKNCLAIHDECYVLEPHPENEEVILTVLNSNEIIVFNFITGNILCKFNEENYFFNNISQNMIALEGKFSPNGDSFVISTYLGSISIYSIYSKNSFSTTHMNQFFDKEFTNEASEAIGSSIALQSDLPFITYVNMYNLPYIMQQPYSKFKLNQLEKTVFKRLIKNYNFSQKQIENKLMNNYLFYSKNLEERRIECEAEEKIFIQAARENLTYMVPDNIENETSESEYESNNSEYDSNEDITSNNILANNDEEDEIRSVSKSSMDLDENRYSEENEMGMYNLRSRRQNNINNNLRNSTRDNAARQSNRISDYTRSRLRNRSVTRNYNSAGDNTNSEREKGNESEISVEENVEQPIKRTRRRLRKINGNRNDEANKFDEKKYYSDENDRDFSSERKLKKTKIFKNNNHNKILEDGSDSETYDKEIKQLVTNCENIETTCFLCKFASKSLIGPFYSQDQKDFKIYNGEVSMIEDEDIITEKFYFHVDCLISFNDYIVSYPKRKGHNNRINLSSTIKEIVQANKTCWRCNSKYATKKCSNENCDRYFHGYNCLPKYCINIDNNMTYCLECYKIKSMDLEAKIVNRKNETLTINNTKVKFNEISRQFFLREKFSYYGYYPQIGDKVFFVIHAYEEFLRNSFENIIFEINEGNIFFWKSEEFFNNNISNNFENCNSYVKPFLCDVMQVEYSFPNPKTITLVKRLYRSEWLEKLRILIKLKLKILSTGKEIQIVFFENEYPDFMISSILYEKNLEFFNNFKVINRRKIISDEKIYINNNENEYEKNNGVDEREDVNYNKNDHGLSIVIGDEIYWANFIKFESKENNEIYKNSLFENILMQYENQDESQEKEFLRISFWDIYNPNLDHSKDEFMISLMEKLSTKIEEIYNRNIDRFSPFYEMVDEVEDMAIDYYNIIQVPMFFKLIKSRLNNFYYLNIQSIEYDLDLIEQNATIYNTPNAQITKNARQLVSELKYAINMIINGLKTKDLNLQNSNSIAKKPLKKSGILRGIDLPDEFIEGSGGNFLNNKRLRRKMEINHSMNNTQSGVNCDNFSLTKSKFNTNRIDESSKNSSTIKIPKESKDSLKKIEIELKEEGSQNSENPFDDENDEKDYDMSDDYTYKQRNHNKNKITFKKNNNFEVKENSYYNLRRKRQNVNI